MKTQESPLGRSGYFVIPLVIGLAFIFDSFWAIVGVGAFVGALIAHVRAVLFIGQLNHEIEQNPLHEVQANIEGIDASMKIRFIFMQSLVGAIAVGLWAALVAGVIIYVV